MYEQTDQVKWKTQLKNYQIIPNALLCANNEATVFFLGLLTPRPKFLGLPSLWPTGLIVVLPPAMVHEDVHVEEVELPPSEPSFLLGGRGESAWAKNCVADNEVPRVFVESCVDEDGMTRRGLGPGFLRAEKYFLLLSMEKYTLLSVETDT